MAVFETGDWLAYDPEEYLNFIERGTEPAIKQVTKKIRNRFLKKKHPVKVPKQRNYQAEVVEVIEIFPKQLMPETPELEQVFRGMMGLPTGHFIGSNYDMIIKFNNTKMKADSRYFDLATEDEATEAKLKSLFA